MKENTQTTVELLQKQNKSKLDKVVGRGPCPGDEVAVERVVKTFKEFGGMKE